MSAGRALAGVVTALYLADRGMSAFGLALVFMAVALSSAVLSAGAGLAADRVGRRPFLVAFPLLTAAAAAVFATVTWLPALVVAASVGSLGRGSGAGAAAVGPYQGAESALAADSVAPRWRNELFGRLALASTLGALLGSLLAMTAHGHHGAPAAVLPAYRPAFVAVAVVSAVAGLLALGIEDPRRAAGVPPPPRAGREGAASWRRRTGWPHRSSTLLLKLWAANGVNGIAVGMFGPFVSYWFYRRFGAGPGTIGLLFAVVNAATLVSALSAAGLARRFGLIRAVSALRFAQGALLVPLVLSPSLAVAGAVYLVRMLVQRAALPLRQSYVLAMAHPDERASVAALSNLPAQLAMGASPLVSGYLLDEVSLALPFVLAGALQVLNAAMYWVFFRHALPEEERPPGEAGSAAPTATAGEDLPAGTARQDLPAGTATPPPHAAS